MLIHRPSYNDWSLPKGKLDPDEYLAGAAVRETVEETAVIVRLRHPVDRIQYPIPSGTKRVAYWLGTVIDQRRFKPNSEVDRRVWLSSIRSAPEKRMTYADERALLEQAVTLPDTTPLLIVRHGKAMERKHWSGKDQLRQLQLPRTPAEQAVGPPAKHYGVAELDLVRPRSVACPPRRLREGQTAGRPGLGHAVGGEEGEGQPRRRPQTDETADQADRRQRRPPGDLRHRPVLPLMLEALGVPNRPMLTAAVLVAHLSPERQTIVVEWHKPRV